MSGVTRMVRIGAIVAVAGLSGCATITYDAGLVEGMVAMNRVAEPGSFERISGFEVSQRPVFAIATLLTVVDADLEQAVTRELTRTGGDAVINLRIQEEYDIIDFAVAAAQSVLLFGAQIVNTRSVTIQGDVVRWTGGQGGDAGAMLPQDCHAIELPAAEGTRTGHICLAPGAAVAEAGTEIAER